MDVRFMKDYFKMRYEDFVRENTFIGAEYHDVQKVVWMNVDKLEIKLQEIGQTAASKSVSELEEYLKVTSEELLKQMNKALDALSDREMYLLEKMYLQGAFDRERMLR